MVHVNPCLRRSAVQYIDSGYKRTIRAISGNRTREIDETLCCYSDFTNQKRNILLAWPYLKTRGSTIAVLIYVKCHLYEYWRYIVVGNCYRNVALSEITTDPHIPYSSPRKWLSSS